MGADAGVVARLRRSPLVAATLVTCAGVTPGSRSAPCKGRGRACSSIQQGTKPTSLTPPASKVTRAIIVLRFSGWKG